MSGSFLAAVAIRASTKPLSAVATGDYAAAGRELGDAMSKKLTDADLENEEKTRAKVKDLVKLGETKWRYRVVEPGQSPRDEAIKVLEQAQQYVNTHVTKVLEKDAALKGEKWTDEKIQLVAEKMKESKWADELSECCQGLALARLIFNGANRDEDGTITALLGEALRMREALDDKFKMADTRNSLGSLAQKQKDYAKAEAEYAMSLEVRQQLTAVTEAEIKEKEQALAQSHVSLGNCFLEMEDYDRALDSLKLALACYVAGFNETHPKVAWALEAMANVYKKQKAWRLADEAIDAAIAIRKAAAQPGFSKELAQAEASNDEIEAQRKAILSKLKLGGLSSLLGGAGAGSGAKNIVLAAKAAGEGATAAKLPWQQMKK